MNLVEEGFEAVVFGEPCADLGKECLGDLDRAGLAALLKRQVLGGMSGAAVMTAASGTATAMGVLAEGGGQHGRGRGELFEAMREHAKDLRGVSGKAHATSESGTRLRGVGWFSGKQGKRIGARKSPRLGNGARDS